MKRRKVVTMAQRKATDRVRLSDVADAAGVVDEVGVAVDGVLEHAAGHRKVEHVQGPVPV